MRNLKKVLALVLALVMAMSLMVTAGATSLSDYKDSGSVTAKYATAVDVATQLGILVGYDDGKYHPQDTLTRAQLATMTYRIATGDVDDVYTANFAGGAAESFTDTPATAWYAGYVGYAADAGYLKGMGDGTYAPNADLTGYQALAAFLRTIGYNQPGQFTGSDWTVQVALIAKQVGALDGITGVDLNKAISREVAAQIIYNIIFAYNVEYTPALGYQSLGGIYGTLAKNEFKVGSDKEGVITNIDDWGRPGTVWYKTDGKTELVTIEMNPVATYTTAVTECQVATDAQQAERTETYATYTNGKANVGSVVIEAADTRNTIGAQGQLNEVYVYDDADGDTQYRVVTIDTYLAEVDSVTAIRTDAAGHLTRDAQLVLHVYNSGKTMSNANYQTVTLTAEENYSYSVGDMVLVNAVTTAANSQAVKVDSKGVAAKLDILKVADSFVGSQSKLFWSSQKHEIGGTEYNDAVRFYLDEASRDQVANHTWFLDQYGNLIGASDIISTNYAVLKNIQWVPVVGENGYAQATLIDFNGNETKVIVDTIDGDANAPFNWDEDDCSPIYNDKYGTVKFLTANSVNYLRISDELSRNAALEGYALYRVDTNLDGTVSLQGVETNGQQGEIAARNQDTANNGVIINYCSAVKITTNASALLAKNSKTDNYDSQLIGVNDNTLYLVKTSDGYDTYTGTAAVPNFLPGAEVFYKDVNGDNIAEYVYVKNGTLESTTGNHVVYVTSDSYSKVTDSNEYVMENVILDGQENSKIAVADLGIAKTLAAGEGKTFVATYTSGTVTAVALSTVNATSVVAPEATSTVVYLGDDVAVSGTTMTGEYTGTTYRIDGAVALGENVALTTSELDGYGVWVVYTPGVYNTVSHIYVGTALKETAAAAIYLNGAATPLSGFSSNALTITGPAADNANLTASALNKGTLGDWTNQNGTYGSATTASITATSEAGNTSVTYNITRQAATVIPTVNLLNNDYTLYVGSAIQDQPSIAYVNKADALNNLKEIAPNVGSAETVVLTIGGVANAAGQTSQLDVYETLAIAQASSFNGSSSETVNLTSGNVILAEITYAGGTCYVAYIVK